MANTSNLQLPYLAVGQAQKHVTLNETLRKLDAIVQLSVVSATTTAEPATPADGDVYIVPAGKSGANWSAFANWALGYYRDGAWVELAPREGWLAFVKDTNELMAWTGSAWSLFPPAKIMTVSATDKVLGRASSGAGAAEEIAFTDQAQQLCDDTSFAAMRTTLGAAGLADANTFSAAQSVTLSAAGTALSLISTDAGNAAGPQLDLNRTSASPVANDVLGVIRYLGRNSSNGVVIYGRIFPYIADPSAGAESSGFAFENMIGGVSTGILLLADAIYAGRDVLPDTDNTRNLGSASKRWGTVYATTGAINTSDAREKTELTPLSDAERRAIRSVVARIGVYRWLDAMTEKGDDARLHIGVTAQAVAEAFEAESLDPRRYALFCEDATASGPQLGVRYDQLLAMAVAALAA